MASRKSHSNKSNSKNSIIGLQPTNPQPIPATARYAYSKALTILQSNEISSTIVFSTTSYFLHVLNITKAHGRRYQRLGHGRCRPWGQLSLKYSQHLTTWVQALPQPSQAVVIGPPKEARKVKAGAGLSQIFKS